VFGSVLEKTKYFKSILECYTFDEPTGNLKVEINPMDAMVVPAGKDSLGRIEEPGGAQNSNQAIDRIWESIMQTTFKD
jgi:hypothetical protein